MKERLGPSSSGKTARLQVIYQTWKVACLLLVLRLFWLMAFPTTASSPFHPMPRWRVDEEHFQTAITSDARGQLLFRDGSIWTTGANHGVIAPELRGFVGEPDVWPRSDKVVAEQGRGGLEESFDARLSGTRPGLAGASIYPGGQTVSSTKPNVTYRISPRMGQNIVTTLQHQAQQRAENLLRRHHIARGSVTVISIPKREIEVLASARRERSDALTAVAPGSVFKLVTATAALDTFLWRSKQMFVCDGTIHLRHVQMHCWRVHGRLSFIDAIAQSCDSVFAQTGVALGRQAILQYSARYGLFTNGLAKVDGRNPISAAEAGVVFRQTGHDEGLLANTAIGQEDVRMTPLQGALLAATIASDGVYQSAVLVTDSQSQNGRRHHLPQTVIQRQVCSPYAAQVVARGMWDAVHDDRGTLSALSQFPIAAKSGTAELPNGHVNAWIVGYTLEDKRPSTAFSFCVEDVESRVAHAKLMALTKDWLKQGVSLPAKSHKVKYQFGTVMELT